MSVSLTTELAPCPEKAPDTTLSIDAMESVADAADGLVFIFSDSFGLFGPLFFDIFSDMFE